MCLLSNTMLQHCYVPERFGYGLIVSLLEDKHGDQSRSDMYMGITLSPTIAKLFEYLLMELYGDQLSSDTLQSGFKKHSGCCHALFTFKETNKYFIKKGSKVYCAFVDASKVFDKVLHNGLFVKLIKKNVSPRFVHILKNWSSKLYTSVMWNGVIGPVFTARCYASAVYAVMQCPFVRLSLCPSVTFVDHVKTNKRIFEIFSPSGSHAILVFPYQMGRRYSDGNPPNGGVKCRWGIGTNRDSGVIAGYRRLLDV